jgi:GNAT superfamily N-acetyltransferase
MYSSHAETSAGPSVLECGPAAWRPGITAGARPNVIRLGTQHESQLSGLLRSLDRPSRVNRFGHPASDACVDGYAKQALSRSVFMAGVAAEGVLVAVVEVFASNRDGIAEVAFAVHGDWRRRGLCSVLLDAAKCWAQQASVTTLRMVIARGNWPMRHLAHKAGARLDLDLDEICADMAVSVPATLKMAA